MKKIILTLLCFLLLSACFNNSSNSPSLEEIIEKELAKANYDEPIFLGLNFEMDSLSIHNHIKDTTIWKFYKTQRGRDRKYMQKKRYENSSGQKYPFYHEEFGDYRFPANDYSIHDGITTETLKIDFFEDSLTLFTKLIFENPDGSFFEETVPFGISIYQNKLRNVCLCISGESKNESYSIDYRPMYDIIVYNFSKKYGMPKYSTDSSTIWINGVVCVSLTYDGVKQVALRKSSLSNDFDILYYPYYIVEYFNSFLEKKYQKMWEDELKEEKLQEQITSSQKQNQLKEKFDPNSF